MGCECHFMLSSTLSLTTTEDLKWLWMVKWANSENRMFESTKPVPALKCTPRPLSGIVPSSLWIVPPLPCFESHLFIRAGGPELKPRSMLELHSNTTRASTVRFSLRINHPGLSHSWTLESRPSEIWRWRVCVWNLERSAVKDQEVFGLHWCQQEVIWNTL